MLVLIVVLLCIAGSGAQVLCDNKLAVTPHAETATFTSVVSTQEWVWVLTFKNSRGSRSIFKRRDEGCSDIG